MHIRAPPLADLPLTIHRLRSAYGQALNAQSVLSEKPKFQSIKFLT